MENIQENFENTIKVVSNIIDATRYANVEVTDIKLAITTLCSLPGLKEIERKVILNKAYGLKIDYSKTDTYTYINRLMLSIAGKAICENCNNGEVCNKDANRIHCNELDASFDADHSCPGHQLMGGMRKLSEVISEPATKKVEPLTWSIDKQFDFCFGHRVWSQELNTEYSLDGCLACRHLHGHQGKIKVFLTSTGLNKGMVTDFKHLNWFKQWVDDALDHKFIIDINDPLFKHECELLLTNGELDYGTLIEHKDGYWVPNMDSINHSLAAFTQSGLITDDKERQAIFEKYEGLVLVDFVPTSEMLCKWWLKVAFKKMIKIGVEVTALEYWETPKSHTRIQRSNLINMEHGSIVLSRDPDLLLEELDILEPDMHVRWDGELMDEPEPHYFVLEYGKYEIEFADGGNHHCRVTKVTIIE